MYVGHDNLFLSPFWPSPTVFSLFVYQTTFKTLLLCVVNVTFYLHWQLYMTRRVFWFCVIRMFWIKLTCLTYLSGKDPVCHTNSMIYSSIYVVSPRVELCFCHALFEICSSIDDLMLLACCIIRQDAVCSNFKEKNTLQRETCKSHISYFLRTWLVYFQSVQSLASMPCMIWGNLISKRLQAAWLYERYFLQSHFSIIGCGSAIHHIYITHTQYTSKWLTMYLRMKCESHLPFDFSTICTHNWE